MRRPVLLGGRTAPRMRSALLWIVWIWLPVLLSLLVIGRESTDTFSSARTSDWLRHLAEALFGPIAQPAWERAHHAVRKTGHFVGYGIVGLCWLRAWLLTWLYPLRLSPVGKWHRVAVLMALLCTMLSASVDELHQTYIPSRTGMVSDAWLDTAGAVALMLLASLFWRRASRGQHTRFA